jgi:hypothetical protein
VHLCGVVEGRKVHTKPQSLPALPIGPEELWPSGPFFPAPLITLLIGKQRCIPNPDHYQHCHWVQRNYGPLSSFPLAHLITLLIGKQRCIPNPDHYQHCHWVQRNYGPLGSFPLAHLITLLIGKQRCIPNPNLRHCWAQGTHGLNIW